MWFSSARVRSSSVESGTPERKREGSGGMSQPRARIQALDGMRAIAILLVIGFHYGARWTTPHIHGNLYPYGDVLARWPLITHGNMGVELFFIVSGFVIALTLAGCTGWREFALKRCARLGPTMWLCAAITFVGLALIPEAPFHPEARDFLPSLSFIDPSLFTRLFHSPFGSIDGVYWSLFIEVKFYFWAALLYFSGRRDRFLARCFSALLIVEAVDLGARIWGQTAVSGLLEFFVFPGYLPWFAAGVGFYELYRNRSNGLAAATVIAAWLILVARIASGDTIDSAELLISVAFLALFAAFVYQPRLLAPLQWRPLVSIGAASYSLYLLHQSLGVALIAWLAHVLGWWGEARSLVLAPLVGLLFILAATWIYRVWEVPAKSWILTLGGERGLVAPGVR